MAITYYGTISCFPILGNDQLTQNLMTLENGTGSRVNVRLRRFSVQNDPVTTLTSVKPLIYSTRIAAGAVTGGIILTKGVFDTTLTSDSNVVIRAAISTTSPITATPSSRLWETYTLRLHSAIQKVIAEDENMIPRLTETNPIIIRPGEGILIALKGAATASNNALANNWACQCMWEEDSIGTFAISGTVTLGGVPVDGAKIIVIEADDESGTNGRLVEITTSNAIGQWSSAITSGRVGAAFVQYVNGGVYYTAPGSPFLE